MKIFFRTKIVSVKHEINVTDESKNPLYKVTSKFISIHDKTVLKNVVTGGDVAEIHRKPVSIHETYYVDMTDGTRFELSTEIFKIVHEQIDIKGLDWTIKGNMLQHDFDIIDENGERIAFTHRKWVSLHESYEVDVVDESRLDTIVAVFAVLDHIMAIREQNTNTR